MLYSVTYKHTLLNAKKKKPIVHKEMQPIMHHRLLSSPAALTVLVTEADVTFLQFKTNAFCC